MTKAVKALPKTDSSSNLSLCVNCFNYPTNGRSWHTCTTGSYGSCRFFDIERCQEEYALGRQNMVDERLGF